MLPELTTLVTSYAASTGTSSLRLGAAELDQRAQPVVLAPALARAGLAVPEHDDGVGLAPQRRASFSVARS